MQLQRLHLYTAVPEMLLPFYRDILNCSVTEGVAGFAIHAGNTVLKFSRSGGLQPTYHFAFTIPWNKVEEALRWTADRVALLPLEQGHTLADFRNWDAKAFYFFDPAGNVVEFIARSPLGLQSNEPFSGRSFASVSEIGLVTDDVALACRQLEELWQVPLFAKQKPTAHFAAAGDDHGLFIVVSDGRNWYPTQTPAVKAPLEAVFQTADGLIRTLAVG